jgi:hypothetical protein
MRRADGPGVAIGYPRELFDGVRGRAVRLGGVDQQCLSAAGGHLERLVGELEATDERVIEHLAPEGLLEDVEARPASGERARAGEKVVDQPGQPGVVGEARRIETKDIGDLLDQRLPLGIQLTRRRFQHYATSDVALLRWPLRHCLIQRRAGRVPRQDLAAAAEHDRGCRGQRIERAQQARPRRRDRRPLATTTTCSVGQRLEMQPVGRAEPHGLRQSVEEIDGGQHAALLQAPQVVGAHTCERRDLFPAQPRHTPSGPGRHAHVLGLRTVAAAPEKLPERTPRFHVLQRSGDPRSSRVWLCLVTP